MQKQFYLTVFISFLSLLSLAQTKINGVVNAYAAVSELDEFSVTVDNSNSFSSNDLVLIIQMKGATIDETLSKDFGTITALNGAGQYEFQCVCSVDGNRVYFKNCLLNDYDKVGAVQLIKLAEYANTEIESMFSVKSYTAANTVSGIDGAAVYYVDGQGTYWSTSYDSNTTQPNWSFAITSHTALTNDSFAKYLTEATFSCTLYDSNGNTKTLTNGSIKSRSVQCINLP